MIPIGDDRIRGAKFPWVTTLIILLNVLVFLVEVSLDEEALTAFIMQAGAVPASIQQGQNLLSLFTSMFLHGGWLHLISNMLFLWVFGDNIEAALGPLGYVLFYLAGGALGSLAHVVTHPSSTIPSVGASGAISAVLGAYLVMFPHSRVRVLLLLGYFLTTARVTAVVFLGLWAVTQLLNGVARLGAATAETAGVAYWAHIGGFVLGLLIGFCCKRRASRLRVEREWL